MLSIKCRTSHHASIKGEMVMDSDFGFHAQPVLFPIDLSRFKSMSWLLVEAPVPLGAMSSFCYASQDFRRRGPKHQASLREKACPPVVPHEHPDQSCVARWEFLASERPAVAYGAMLVNKQVRLMKFKTRSVQQTRVEHEDSRT